MQSEDSLEETWKALVIHIFCPLMTRSSPTLWKVWVNDTNFSYLVHMSLIFNPIPFGSCGCSSHITSTSWLTHSKAGHLKAGWNVTLIKLLRNIKYLVPKDRGFKELLLELMGPKPVESYSKYKTVQTSPNPKSSINFPDYLARAGVAMSVWTAMDMGTPPQWMLPRVSFSAMLYLGVSMFKTFPSDDNIFHLHPRSWPLTWSPVPCPRTPRACWHPADQHPQAFWTPGQFLHLMALFG